MKLRFTRPTRRRRKAFAKTFAGVGSAIGSLPVTVRPGAPSVPRVAKLDVPAAVVTVVAVVLVRRRRTEEPAPESWSAPTTSEPATPGVPDGSSLPPTETVTEQEKDHEKSESGTQQNGA